MPFNQIRILLFASAREIVGKKEMEVKLDGDQISASSLRKIIIQAYPELSAIPFVLSVNRRVPTNESNVSINQSDEVAVLPPVSGG